MEGAIILEQLKGHTADVNCISAQPPLLASASDDGSVRVWDLRINKSVKRVTAPQFFPNQ